MHIQHIRLPGHHATEGSGPIAVLLGTNDIASAIARTLFLTGWGVVMLRDGGTPVLRRGMAFDDALHEGMAELDGVWGVPAPMAQALPALARAREAVVLSMLDLAVFAASYPGLASVLVDARMRKYAAPADLRPLAPLAIGVGPGFIAETNVDLAIETLPGQEGTLIAHGATATPTGRAVPLGGAGEERFIYAPAAGPWQPRIALGSWVMPGTVIGRVGAIDIVAPIEGCLRGIVRRQPTGVARGAKLVEIDPRVDATSTGVAPRAQRIANGVNAVLQALMPANMIFAG